MSNDALQSARSTLAAEAEGLTQLAASLGDDLVAAVDMLANAKGRVIISGMGKSGHIGSKNYRHHGLDRHTGSIRSSRRSQPWRFGHDYAR